MKGWATASAWSVAMPCKSLDQGLTIYKTLNPTSIELLAYDKVIFERVSDKRLQKPYYINSAAHTRFELLTRYVFRQCMSAKRSPIRTEASHLESPTSDALSVYQYQHPCSLGDEGRHRIGWWTIQMQNLSHTSSSPRFEYRIPI